MTPTHAERELKLIVPADWELASDRLGAFTLDPEVVIGLSATYYDTPDLRLARSGASLRYREPDGWTVKLPTTSRRLMARTEVTVDGIGPGAVPDELLDVVTAFVRRSPVVPVATLRTERRARVVRDDRGRPVAELTDDMVDAAPIGDTMVDVRRFRELEVELGDATPSKRGRRLADALADAGAHDDVPLAKIVRVLGSPAREPADLPNPPEVSRSSDVATLVTAAIRHSVNTIFAYDAQMRLTDEPDLVHDARVAVRRLRADLRTFARVLRVGELTEVRDHLRWLGAALGEVRDADVLSANIVAASVGLDEIDQIESLALQHQLTEERRAAYGRLMVDLRSARYLTLLDGLVELATAPPVRRKAATRPAAGAVVGLVERRWDRLARQVDELGDEPDAAELHAVRIAAKKVRYAAEASAPVIGRDARRLARQLAKLQTELGDHHDAGVGRAWLTSASATGIADGYSAFVAGEIAHALLIRQRTIEGQWRARWTKVVARQPARWSAS